MINPGDGKWIGVLGGGQLGRMLALEARRMGVRVMQWTGGDKSGAALLADRVLDEPFDSAPALETFLDQVDVVTVEFENIPRDLLEKIEQRRPLLPGSFAVATCQHREREKLFLADKGIPCAGFRVVDSAETLSEALEELGGDVILKTAEFGYDGKGQLAIDAGCSAEEAAKIWAGFDCPRAVVEEKIALKAELSVLVVRSQEGGVASYDPAENQHLNHILDLSILPARLPDSCLTEAREIAIRVTRALDYAGLLAVEFFVDADDRLLVNEIAPRAHNSGHHTLDACETSQFEQQVRVLSGLPLGSTRLTQPAVLWNLLGDLWIDESTPPDWSPVLNTPGAKLHLYGKSHARPGRKMGHVTFTGATREEAIECATTCRVAYGLPVIQ